MLNILLNSVMFVFCVLILRLPFVGIILYYWFSIANPHRLVWSNSDIRWLLIINALLVLSLFLSNKGKLKINWIMPTLFFTLFFIWTNITTVFAVYSVSTEMYITFLKTFIITMLTIALTDSREKLNALVWVIVISASVYILREGAKTILSGGTHKVTGPIDTMFTGNNEVSRLFGMALPFVLFLCYHAQRYWVRKAMFILFFMDIVAIVGTNSRGAFAALLAVFFFIFIRSQRKFFILVLVGVMATGAMFIQSEEGEKRAANSYSSINEYDSDSSFQGRVFAWNYAMHDVMEQSPFMGLGFGAFRGAIYAPGHWRDAHSVYFEALGEHGIVGLLLFLLIAVTTVMTSRKVERVTKNHKNLYWERDLAIAIQICMIFYLVGGTLISHTYLELYYVVVAITIGLDGLVKEKLANSGAA